MRSSAQLRSGRIRKSLSKFTPRARTTNECPPRRRRLERCASEGPRRLLGMQRTRARLRQIRQTRGRLPLLRRAAKRGWRSKWTRPFVSAPSRMRLPSHCHVLFARHHLLGWMVCYSQIRSPRDRDVPWGDFRRRSTNGPLLAVRRRTPSPHPRRLIKDHRSARVLA